MAPSTLLLIAAVAFGVNVAIDSPFASAMQTARSESSLLFDKTCQEIASSISAASAVYPVASVQYLEDINHWASSSTQFAACSFEPGTTEDVGVALRILGQAQTPFAVKGGGHTTNPGFSSTEGVQIAMSRFSDVIYDSTAQTATIGAGLIWDDVYAALEPFGVNVVGGRVSGVGVAGFTLGGGYSWLTNQYGLTLDTVQAFELVMPNGTATNVTELSSPDLFFALKGGLNNFGIVTRFTLKTFPQTQVWGGLITYTADAVAQLNLATADFTTNNQDPKAQVILSYNTLLGEANLMFVSAQPVATLIVFYDAPTQPLGVFDEFLAITPLTQVLSTSSFPAFVKSIPAVTTFETRAAFNTVSLTDFPLSLLESIFNESTFWASALSESVYFVSYEIEPFLPTLLSHDTTPSAYPPDRTQGFFPLNIYFGWLLPGADQAIFDAVRASAQTIQERAVALDVAGAIVYPNYAVFDTPLVDLYGANLPRLQAIKAVADPENVMGLAGGFKL